MKVVNETLLRLGVGPPTTHGNLTLFPLLGGSERPPDYATLDEAIRGGWFDVSEISQGGSVPELKVANRGDRAVLMMDGEELVGAKQNRVLNLTILVPPGRTIVVPVSCVEQGRWAHRTAKMAGSADALFAKARVLKMASVSRSYRQFGRPTSDQLGVWARIQDKLDGLGAVSPTAAMADAYRNVEQELEGYLRAFEAVDGQTGAMFAVGGRLTGFELFEHPQMLRKMLQKIVRSYALDAIEEQPADAQPTRDDAGSFLRRVAEAEAQTFPAVGAGVDVRISGPGVTAAALVDGERLVHLSAFRVDDDAAAGGPGGRRSRVASASDRLRRRSE